MELEQWRSAAGQESLRAKLFAKFDIADNSLLNPGEIFIWNGAYDERGQGYGKYSNVSKAELESRPFEVGADGESVKWLDVWFDPKLNLFYYRDDIK